MLRMIRAPCSTHESYSQITRSKIPFYWSTLPIPLTPFWMVVFSTAPPPCSWDGVHHAVLEHGLPPNHSTSPKPPPLPCRNKDSDSTPPGSVARSPPGCATVAPPPAPVNWSLGLPTVGQGIRRAQGQVDDRDVLRDLRSRRGRISPSQRREINPDLDRFGPELCGVGTSVGTCSIGLSDAGCMVNLSAAERLLGSVKLWVGHVSHGWSEPPMCGSATCVVLLPTFKHSLPNLGGRAMLGRSVWM